MYMKNGVVFNGSKPRENPGPRIVSYRSQQRSVPAPGRRLEAFMDGSIRACIFRSLGGLGDIMMATPIARSLKAKYPKSEVTYAVPIDYANGDLPALLENNPYIDEVIDYKLVRRNDYDLFVDITRTGLREEAPYSNAPNRIDLFAEAVGIPLIAGKEPIYILTEEEKRWGEEFVKKAKEGKEYKGLVSIHLGSRDPRRSWPHSRIRDLVVLLKQAGYLTFLFEWGARPDDWKFSQTVQVFNYRIRQAVSILEVTDILVCPDSLLLHIAGALRKRTISLFGSIPPASRINHYPYTKAVRSSSVRCLGCFYASCSSNHTCMSSITAEEVFLNLESHINFEPGEITKQEKYIVAGSKKISTFKL